MKFIEADSEWINLVITECGDRLMCRTYDNEKDCRYEMVEDTKKILNDFFSSLGAKNDYNIIEVDSNDVAFRKLVEVTTKRESRLARFPLLRVARALHIKFLEIMVKLINKVL